VCVYYFTLLHYSFFFFFSSRRRHTRWPRDWSSDVCSSDLASTSPDGSTVERPSSLHGGAASRRAGKAAPRKYARGRSDALPDARSEERRVGKECRSGWSAEQ